MSAECENSVPIVLFPTELLLKIFTLLEATDIAKVRRVCSRWKEIADSLLTNDSFWRAHLEKDFKSVYEEVLMKSATKITPFEIYQSLSLWSKFHLAEETQDEFGSASKPMEEIESFMLHKNGKIGVHKKNAIMYYNALTFQQEKLVVPGTYVRYEENDDLLLLLGPHLHLYIYRKIERNHEQDLETMFPMIKFFVLLDDEFYFVNVENKIYNVKADDYFTSKMVVQSHELVMAIGYTDGHLHVLTHGQKVYTIVDGLMVEQCLVENTGAAMDIIRKYNFMLNMDWVIFFRWMSTLYQKVPDGPLRNIMTIRCYGKYHFVGSNWGVLRIYYVPSEELNIIDLEPIKQYNFCERSDCPVLSTCPIIGIEIMEVKQGHRVYVAMPKKIIVLCFNHDFMKTSTALLPYTEGAVMVAEVKPT